MRIFILPSRHSPDKAGATAVLRWQPSTRLQAIAFGLQAIAPAARTADEAALLRRRRQAKLKLIHLNVDDASGGGR